MSAKNSNSTLGLKLRCASIEHRRNRSKRSISRNQKPDRKLGTSPKFSARRGATRPRDVRTCPGTRAHEGRSERRAVLSRAHGAEQRDGQVRFSVRPCLPELGLGIRACHSTSAICSCGIPGLERAVCRVSLFHRHDHTSHFDVAINGLSCVAGRSSYQGIKATSRNRGCDVGPLGAQDQR